MSQDQSKARSPPITSLLTAKQFENPSKKMLASIAPVGSLVSCKKTMSGTYFVTKSCRDQLSSGFPNSRVFPESILFKNTK